MKYNNLIFGFVCPFLAALVSCAAGNSVGRPMSETGDAVMDALLRSPKVEKYATEVGNALVVMEEGTDGADQLFTIGKNTREQVTFGIAVKLTPDGRVFVREINDLGENMWISE